MSATCGKHAPGTCNGYGTECVPRHTPEEILAYRRAERPAYNPVTGEGYTQSEARAAWSASMRRGAPAWSLQGEPGAWWWRYFNFRPWFGRVTVETDGIRWSTHHDYDGAVIHQGITTSIYEAYQSVVQNRPVTRSEVPS